MTNNSKHKFLGNLSLLLTLALTAFPSHAYMGPGAGITAIGCLIALLAGIWYTFKGFLWLPLKRLLKKGKNTESVSNETPTNEEPINETSIAENNQENDAK